MFYLATTRFNTKTWQENCRWREKHQWEGCVYGSPVRISDKYIPNTKMFVLEMHNDENKIQGIGLIKNKIEIGKYHKIYDEGNYNRYTYKGIHRISRSELTQKQKKIIRILDILVFKGSRHLKRGQGVKVVPEWITNNSHIDFIQLISEIFKTNSKLK